MDVLKTRLRQSPKAPPKDNAILLGLILVASFVVGDESANAADLPNLKAPPVSLETPAPAFSWTGFYAGINAGYGTDQFAFVETYGTPGGFEKGSGVIDSNGAVAGGQIGYNYEFSNLPFIGHAVAGVELDSDWASVRGSTTVPTALGSLAFGTKFENFGTARGRLGYNFDRLLLYFTGGLTYGTVEANYSAGGFAGSTTATHSGMFPKVGVVGCGLEYAVFNNISVKVEYLYDFTGARFDQFSPAPGTAIGFGNRSMYHIARIGVNYKFDWLSPSTPVAVKY